MQREPTARLTSRDVLTIAVPIILSNVTTPLVGAVDTAAVGQLGEEHLLGAVAVGATIFSILYWTFGFLRMGTTGLTAQAFGADNKAEVGANLKRALLIALSAGCLLVLLQWPLGALLFWLFPGSDAVESAARTYFDIRIWGAPAALANYALLGWFIGLGRAKLAFAIQLLLNGLNIAFDALFVFGFSLDVDGVAYGTVLAETIAALAGLALAVHELRRQGADAGWAEVMERARMLRLISVNTDIMIRSFSLIFAFSFFTAQGANAGDVTLAANAVLFTFFHIAAYFLDGFAFAAETLVGQSIGAGNRKRFLAAVRLSSLWALAISIVVSLGLWVAGPHLIALMTTAEDVRQAAGHFLFWAALSPGVGIACFQLDGIFIGATQTRDMRNMMLISLAIYLLAWAALTSFWGNHGLWAALWVFFIARGVTLAARMPALIAAAFAKQGSVRPVGARASRPAT